MTPEGRVKDRFKKALVANLPLFAWRFMPVQTGFGSVAHDFILCYDGLFFTIEAKKDAKSPITALQNSTKEAIEAAGGVFLLVYDDESITAAVNRIKHESEYHGRHGRKDRPQVQAQDQGTRRQHLCEQQQNKTPDGAVGGDHGAPRTPPARRAKPAACVDHSYTSGLDRCDPALMTGFPPDWQPGD